MQYNLLKQSVYGMSLENLDISKMVNNIIIIELLKSFDTGIKSYKIILNRCKKN